jgi:hypothetical protein
MTGTVSGGETPSATTISPGTMTAHFRALAVGTSRVTIQYQGKGGGYPLSLTVKVVAKD